MKRAKIKVMSSNGSLSVNTNENGKQNGNFCRIEFYNNPVTFIDIVVRWADINLQCN
ncbi:MAG: hypothetical protein KKH74_02725 [Gammaproteobacteria bacterium]|nr:hypothetical protein [Gammaproteobacteria bacterium]MBU1732905.1 hypothetical protein [Gammaproteobacteria bacterium]MBU1891953.1 hypothetical protein [Gammaproteobacteria bacterium]